MADKVFINGLAAVHKGSAGKSIAFPDVCLCPPTPPAGPIPTPLPNTVQAMDLDGGAQSVLIDGNPSGKKTSFFKKSTGNEVSRPTGGGVITHGVQGKAYFVTCSPNVMFEGEPAVRHMDLLTHNHMGPQPGNTPPSPWLSTMSLPPVAPKTTSRRVGKGKAWLRVALRDTQGVALRFVRYELKTRDGAIVAGRTLTDGLVDVRQIPEGSCELRLPDFDHRGWKGARPGALTTGAVHEIRQGDTCARAAWEKGFAQASAVWEAAENAELVRRRKNPDLLVTGDLLVIPPKKVATFSLDPNKEHTLSVERPTFRLHLELDDGQGKALGNCRYELRFPALPELNPLEGKTNGRGVLDAKVPLDVWIADLYVWEGNAREDSPHHWPLLVGALDPIEELTGVQARLDNLGFSCGGEHGTWGAHSQAALEEFQRAMKIDEEGAGALTRGKLVELYGC